MTEFSMPNLGNKIEDPCQECRERHLKCDDNPKCKQCERLGGTCRRGKGRLRFRYGSSARYDANFSKDQTWLEQTKNAKFQFVDQGPELENYYSQDDFAVNNAKPVAEEQRQDNTRLDPYKRLQHRLDPDLSPTLHGAPSSEPLPFLSPTTSNNETALNSGAESWQQQTAYDPVRGDTSHIYRIYTLAKPYSPVGVNGVIAMGEPRHIPKVVEAEYGRLADSAAATIPDESLLSPAAWKEDFYWPNKNTTTQCACLMRYYIDHLAAWFDVGDPSRHFTLTVPQRARRCPPLLNAIFTAASRHLANVAQHRTADGIVVKYQDVLLPTLTQETAVKYHNACIAYLIKLSNDQEHVRDENLLAAAVILRYYEEIDTAFTGEDSETFLRPFQVFVNAQLSPYSHILDNGQNPEYLRPGSAAGIYENTLSYLKSFQHAAFRIALRQETTIAFLKQRAVRLPLETWSILQGFDEVEDFVWADRHLYHCANVLQFCFGGVGNSGLTHIERWNQLKQFETQWDQAKPLSFAPIHYQEPNRSKGECLPQIWYMAEIHVTGLLFLDLARILLTVYNPNIPRIGPGVTAAHRHMTKEVHDIVIRLCGTAMSNPSSRPAMVQAYMAIAVCGEYFSDPVEQKALLGILDKLKKEHGWPTGRTALELKREWGWT